MGQGLRDFSKEDIQITNRHRRKRPALLIIGEMQILTTVSDHLMPDGRAASKKKNDSDWPGRGEIETLVHCWRDCKVV